jgi:hypothetical protein
LTHRERISDHQSSSVAEAKTEALEQLQRITCAPVNLEAEVRGTGTKQVEDYVKGADAENPVGGIGVFRLEREVHYSSARWEVPGRFWPRRPFARWHGGSRFAAGLVLLVLALAACSLPRGSASHRQGCGFQAELYCQRNEKPDAFDACVSERIELCRSGQWSEVGDAH